MLRIADPSYTKGECPCRPLAHLILDNSGSDVFAWCRAQAAIQPHLGGLLECGGLWTRAARLLGAH